MGLAPQPLKPQPAMEAAPPAVAPKGRALLWLAVAIGLGLLLLVAIEPDDGPQPIEYASIAYFLGTLLGQAIVAGGWAALGPLPLVWRLPLSLGWLAAMQFAVMLNLAFRGQVGSDDVLILGASLLGLWLLIQLPLWWIPLGMGLSLRHLSEPSRGPRPSDRQFGVRQLMIATGVVAVVLGVGRLLLPWIAIDNDMIIFTFLAIAGAVMMLPLVLAALLPQHAVLASLVSLVLIVLATTCEAPLLQMFDKRNRPGGPDFWHFLGINMFQAAWVLAILAGLRLGGYRLAAAPASE